jgi:hypothetical protein
MKPKQGKTRSKLTVKEILQQGRVQVSLAYIQMSRKLIFVYMTV